MPELTEREQWAGQNMYWGGTLRWQLECERGCIFVVVSERPRRVQAVDPKTRWSPDLILLQK